MITIRKKRKKRNVDIDGRLTCERTSPSPRGPSLGTLEDPDGARPVHG